MSRAFTPGLIVARNVTVRKRRELPVIGEILPKVGDSVRGDQIVAQARLPGELVILRLPERMGLEAFEVFKGLKIKEGDSVEEGALICEHIGLFGLFRTRFKAPDSGEIEFISKNTGHVGLRLPSIPLDVTAYVDGEVVEVEQGKSVVIEASGAFVQGIFGVGGEQRGELLLLDVERDASLSEQHLPADVKGKILVGGMSPSLEFLKAASEAGALGLITGSIDDRALAGYLGYDLGIALTGDEDIQMSIIVTEGFGDIPQSRRPLTILKEFAGKTASINGATQVRAGAVRPEVLVASDSHSGAIAREELETGLEVGSSIRVIRVPYFGQRGVVTELPHQAERIETGASTRVLRAKLSSGEEVTVPRANVELIESEEA